MKITQEKVTAFQPINIKIETREEAKFLYVLANVSDEGLEKRLANSNLFEENEIPDAEVLGKLRDELMERLGLGGAYK